MAFGVYETNQLFICEILFAFTFLLFNLLFCAWLCIDRKNLGKCWRLYIFHLLCAILFPNQFAHSAQASPNCRVKMIFNRIVCSEFDWKLPAGEVFSDRSPLISVDFMHFENDLFLFICPASFGYFRVQMVVVSK